MGQRILTAAVGAPLLLLMAYLGGPYWAVTVAMMAWLGTTEFFSLTRRLGLRACRWVGLAGSQVAVVLAYYYGEAGLARGVVLLAVVTLIAIVVDSRRRPVDWAMTFWGTIYPGCLLSFAVLLRNQPGGALYLIALWLITWANDTGAYFAGRWWGRRKLAPRLSPHKTWEGAAGGLLLSLGIAAALFFWQPVATGAMGRWLAAAAILAGAGLIGDLAESAWKRQAGVKDAGRLLPGHGGVLDRFDGFILMAPLAYYLVDQVI